MKKNVTKILTLLMLGTVILFTSCNKDEEEDPLTKEDLVFTIEQTEGYDNEVTLTNSTPNTTAFWDYGTGTSTLNTLSVVYPFAGEYTISLTVTSEKGDVVEADPVTITVSSYDAQAFSEEEWALLTNGAAGKTWVIDMAGYPTGFHGLDWTTQYDDGDPEGDQYWEWHPDYQSWLYPYLDYGSMTFNLDGDFNMTVNQKDEEGNASECAGTFDLNLAEGQINLTCPMLNAPSMYGQTTIDTDNGDGTWTKGDADTTLFMSNVKIIKLVQDTLVLAWKRPEPNEAGGSCFVSFQYVDISKKATDLQ